jgi:hypothetical protein
LSVDPREDIRARKIHVIVVYKVDRLTRSLADFAKRSSGQAFLSAARLLLVSS